MSCCSGNGREPIIGVDSNLSIRTMLDNTVIFGLEELAHGMPAFVNCTVDSLTEEWVRVLPAQKTVLELPSWPAPTPDLLTACRKLKALGFRLALRITLAGRSASLWWSWPIM